MSIYTHILVGLDLSDESLEVLAKAQKIAAALSSKISLIHVVEPLSYTHAGDMPMDLPDLEEKMQVQARQFLSEVGSMAGIDSENQHVLLGQPANEMHYWAADNNVDLIVVGSHGRHGLALLFGARSTTDSLISRDVCDVLAVRIEHTPS